MSPLSRAVQVYAGDIALHLSPVLRTEIESLRGGAVWPEGMEIVELRGRAGHTVGFGTKTRLDEIRMGWAAALKRGADAWGWRYLEIGPKAPEAEKALGEIERLARLGRYCLDPRSGPMYEFWLRIGFAQSRRFETVNLQRSFELSRISKSSPIPMRPWRVMPSRMGRARRLGLPRIRRATGLHALLRL